MIISQVTNLLEKQNKLNQRSLLKMGLRKPHIASKLIYERIKFGITKKTKNTKVKLFFGDEMNVVLPEKASEFLYYFRFLEYGLTRIVLQYLKPGMIFADVGAHFGYFSLLTSKIVGETGRVHSFEPTKSSFEVLASNSKSPNQHINNLACWSKDSFLEFYEYGIIFSAYNSFTKPRLKNSNLHVSKNKIKCIKLDTYFTETYPDFIKIDAESAELEILKGVRKIIEQKHPIITLEVGDIVGDLPESRKPIEYLLDRNYDCFEFKNGKILEHSIKNSYGYDNLLFLEQK